MTPSKKLFIAATLVAAGYGVAAQLGAPDPRRWPDSLAQFAPASSRSTTSAAYSANTSPVPSKVGSVRLLPESPTESLDPLRNTENSTASTPTTLTPPLFAESSVAEAPATFLAVPGSSLRTARPVPRATLKNEAPRPLPEAGRPATPIPVSHVDATAYEQPIVVRQVNANNNVQSAGFVPAANGAATIRAPMEPPLQPMQTAQLTGPNTPWPIEEAEPLRTHVIVDGDSLAKLAGRYLDDPRRSEEIFALNRGVLTDPELLPIDAELKIPPRNSLGVSENALLQSQTIGTPNFHAVEHTGLVPVRRLPSPSIVAPRAQLLPPRPVE